MRTTPEPTLGSPKWPLKSARIASTAWLKGLRAYLITLSISWQGCGPFETGGPGYEIELTGGANRLTVDTR
jgi:hypothetical protein